MTRNAIWNNGGCAPDAAAETASAVTSAGLLVGSFKYACTERNNDDQAIGLFFKNISAIGMLCDMKLDGLDLGCDGACEYRTTASSAILFDGAMAVASLGFVASIGSRSGSAKSCSTFFFYLFFPKIWHAKISRSKKQEGTRGARVDQKAAQPKAMDEIADSAFQSVDDLQSGHVSLVDDVPSLLTVVVDVNPSKWFELKATVSIKEVVKAVCVLLNAHLALNSSNKVAVLCANNFNDSNDGAKFIYPRPEAEAQGTTGALTVDASIYRQFKFVDEAILRELSRLLSSHESFSDSSHDHFKNSMSGAMSMALAYINKLNRSQDALLKSRILVVSVSDDATLPYISTMNCIFAAQKMKIPIDVVKLGSPSIFLQQASDSTHGVYQLIKKPKGLVQYLSSAFFIDPSLRSILVLPTDSKIDFRASCFLTNKVINIGYVCSVCLCILSLVPPDHKCPVCDSKFDESVIKKLKQRPGAAHHKKRKTA